MKGIRIVQNQPEIDAGECWLGRHPVLSYIKIMCAQKTGTLGLTNSLRGDLGIDMKVFGCFRE